MPLEGGLSRLCLISPQFGVGCRLQTEPAEDALRADPRDLSSIKFPDKPFSTAYSQGIVSTLPLSAQRLLLILSASLTDSIEFVLALKQKSAEQSLFDYNI